MIYILAQKIWLNWSTIWKRMTPKISYSFWGNYQNHTASRKYPSKAAETARAFTRISRREPIQN
jgi:hypothetical protein